MKCKFKSSVIMFNNLLEWVPGLRKLLFLELRFNYRGYYGIGLGGYQTQIFSAFFPWSHLQACHQPDNSCEPWCTKFLLGFHYVGVISVIIGHMIELPWSLVWLRFWTFWSHGWSFSWPVLALIISLIYTEVWSKGLLINEDLPVICTF